MCLCNQNHSNNALDVFIKSQYDKNIDYVAGDEEIAKVYYKGFC